MCDMLVFGGSCQLWEKPSTAQRSDSGKCGAVQGAVKQSPDTNAGAVQGAVCRKKRLKERD